MATQLYKGLNANAMNLKRREYAVQIKHGAVNPVKFYKQFLKDNHIDGCHPSDWTPQYDSYIAWWTKQNADILRAAGHIVNIGGW